VTESAALSEVAVWLTVYRRADAAVERATTTYEIVEAMLFRQDAAAGLADAVERLLSMQQ
jgi:hypothetical protein